MRNSKLLLSTALATALFSAGVSYSQEVAESVDQTSEAPAREEETSRRLGDVVVTAQRTSSTVQTTPIALSALDAQALADRQATNVGDIAAFVPGLLIEPVTSASNASRIVLRGVGQEQGGILYDPGVGLYVDDVYQPRINGSYFDFFDIDRVEVLRGPQGTLYGRNSSGGAIKIITRSPSLTEPAFEADAAIGNYNSRTLRAYVSTPLAQDQLAVSASAVYRKRDGYISAPNFGRDVNEVESLSARTKLLYAPSSAFQATFSLDYMGDRGDAGIGVPLTVYPGVDNPNASPDRDLYSTELFGISNSNLDSYGAVANFRYDLNENLTFVSISGYRQVEVEQASPFAELSGGRILGGDYKYKNTSFSQELNLEFDYGRVEGVVGLYYFDEEGDQERGYLGVTTPLVYSTRHFFNRKTEAYAAFAEVNYQLTDTVTLIGGVRATKEEAFLSQLYPTIFNQTQEASDSFSDVTPKIGVQWDATANMMLYASATKGFKSGGFNGLTPNINPSTGERFGPEVYDPETVWSYEAGLKFTSSDGSFRTNIAVFQADYTDVQLPALLPGTVVSTTRNAASATVRGIEVEPTWRPNDWLELWGAFSLTDGEYTSDYDCANISGVFVDCSGNDLKGLIPVQGTAGVRFTPDFDMPGDLSFGADYRYTSDHYNNVSNQPRIARADAIGLLNGFVKWESPDQMWTVALEGKNLLDEEYYKNALALSNATSPSVTAYPGEPRMVSVRVGYKFK